MTETLLPTASIPIEYTDYWLERGMGKSDEYKEASVLLLKIPAEFRQSAWMKASEQTPKPLVEDYKVVYSGRGFNDALERIVSDYLALSE